MTAPRTGAADIMPAHKRQHRENDGEYLYYIYIRLSSHEIAQYNDIEVIFIAVLIKFGLRYVYYVFCGMYTYAITL